MVSQKMISVKLDLKLLDRLDDLCSSIGCNRNKLINFAVQAVCDNLSTWQMCKLVIAYDSCLDCLKSE